MMFHVKPRVVDEDVDREEVVSRVSALVAWARRQAAARTVCIIDSHVPDLSEVDEYDQTTCLRCGRWVYVD